VLLFVLPCVIVMCVIVMCNADYTIEQLEDKDKGLEEGEGEGEGEDNVGLMGGSGRAKNISNYVTETEENSSGSEEEMEVCWCVL